ncbi:hypothetical protein ASPCAL15094 [Aspergillus calidoustus]|uniref:Copper-fist domain-containing protein n=1 Tax=Aspergillus calidoustus TaxID=454130 RepID=A0A0U5GJP1_ASPCI|nr:hypothetical protein ASPCAL15094 [Aspergillus calidoustus]
MLIDGEKWAYRPLTLIKKKGRPVSQCLHCRTLRESRSAHVKCGCGPANPEKRNAETRNSYPQCNCARGERCACALKTEPSMDPVSEPSWADSHPHHESNNTLAETESAVAVHSEDYSNYSGQFYSIQTSASANARESQTLDQHTSLQYNSAEDNLPTNPVMLPAEISYFTGLSSAMVPEHPAQTARDDSSVQPLMAESPNLDMSLFSAVDLPAMTTLGGSMNDINSGNFYGEEVFPSTYTRFIPGLTEADAYTLDWEGLQPDLLGSGNAELLEHMPHAFAPYDPRFSAPLLPDRIGQVEELGSSSNRGNKGISQPYTGQNT